MTERQQQAFPCVNPNYDGNWNRDPVNEGMTLRDYFAGQALIGNLSSGLYNMSHFERAEWAYGQADAMMATRDLSK